MKAKEFAGLALNAALFSTSNGFTVPSTTTQSLGVHKGYAKESTLWRLSKLPESTKTSPVKATQLYMTLPSLPPMSVETKAMTNELTLYFFQTLISVGVPALITVIAFAFIASMMRRNNEEDRGNRQRDGFASMMMGGKRNKRFNGQPSFDGGINAAEELYDDLYGPDEDETPFSLQKLFGGGNRGQSGKGFSGLSNVNKQKALINAGIPVNQYIRIERLNDIYTSYQFSMDSATKSKAYAASKVRRTQFDRALAKAVMGPVASNGASLPTLTSAEETDLLREEREFLKEAGSILADIQRMQSKITQIAIGRAMEDMDVQIGELDPHHDDAPTTTTTNAKNINATDVEIVEVNKSSVNSTSDKLPKKKAKKTTIKNYEAEINKLYKEIAELLVDLTGLEANFIQTVVQILGPSRANGIRVAILGNVNSPQGSNPGSLTRTLQERPIVAVLKELGLISDPSHETSKLVTNPQTGRRVFVTEFPGDVTASQVAELREEVTAIVQAAQPGDEALLVLQSGGGTVTGYGLAAAQLQRFKAAGMTLTICVEQVAASGGYMMCCVADKIIASPFAVLGSIGVISDTPNVYERLKKEGIEFQTVTAGKYKRTLTPTKKVTKEDLEKSKEDIEDILKLFKGFVAKNRPSLDIEAVATGETWFGEDALERNLCDEIRTKDEVILEYITKEGCDVYDVMYDPLDRVPAGLGGLPFGKQSNQRTAPSFLSQPIRWLVRTIAQEVKSELENIIRVEGITTSDSVTKRYMAVDNTDATNRVKASSSSDVENQIIKSRQTYSDDDIYKLF